MYTHDTAWLGQYQHSPRFAPSRSGAERFICFRLPAEQDDELDLTSAARTRARADA